MEKYLNQGIKAVIEDLPQVGKILEKFDIGCTSCMVGTCLLKDVVDIHDLSPETEAQMMFKIEKAIYPDRQLAEPTKDNYKPKKFSYSPPIETLVEEHQVIKRWLALIPKVVKELNTTENAWQWMEKGVELIQNYADRYHHAKEEDILFKYVDENTEIIQSMYDEHIIGRGHVRSILDAIESKDSQKAISHLMAYRELLIQHIKKEDEILYPWIDRELSGNQVEDMSTKFKETDAQAENPQKYIDFITTLENKLS